jgi:hypothetical protein
LDDTVDEVIERLTAPTSLESDAARYCLDLILSCSLSQFQARASCLERIPAQNDENQTDLQVAREYINNMKRLILASLLGVFAASGALAQITITVPGGHDREWYENHGYVWRDGQWYRGEPREHQHHHGYWKDGQYYRYDEDHD